MARKTRTVTITDPGRDHGKVFLLTEMPARRAEKWAARALLALAKSGVDMPDDIRAGGMAGIAILGLRALGSMDFADAEPLLDEMMKCVQIMPDPARPDIIRELVDHGTDGDDIEEVATRLHLRAEVYTLHVGFSMPGAQSTPGSTTPGSTSSSTPTSRGGSGP